MVVLLQPLIFGYYSESLASILPFISSIASLPYALALAPIEAESPVRPLCVGLVPDLQRIAGYAEVEEAE